ncbi:hypothetical protein LX36DRAFT_649452 [Colletotrichum falcatum]|nr:hypothetical protein LX36DRAFT_649452 [Colletotrichum falcatum]
MLFRRVSLRRCRHFSAVAYAINPKAYYPISMVERGGLASERKSVGKAVWLGSR